MSAPDNGTEFKIGDRVRIKTGRYSGQTGIVKSSYNKSRTVIEVRTDNNNRTGLSPSSIERLDEGPSSITQEEEIGRHCTKELDTKQQPDATRTENSLQSISDRPLPDLLDTSQSLESQPESEDQDQPNTVLCDPPENVEDSSNKLAADQSADSVHASSPSQTDHVANSEAQDGQKASRISQRASVIRCPRCAGPRIEHNIVSGKSYLCRECGLAFSEALVPPPCPKCGSTENVGRNTWKIKPGERVWVLMRCNSCRVKFPLHQELRYKHYPLQVYAYVIYHLLNGMSLEKVRNGLRQVYHIDVCTATVWNWWKEWAELATPFLLRLKIDTSGIIYLDEMQYQFEHEASDGRKYSEVIWQFNAWDPVKKTHLAARLARSRDADVAAQVITGILERIRMPEGGITFWCDGLPSYRTAFQRLVAQQKIDENIVRLNSVPKTTAYSIVNEIEGVNKKWRDLLRDKLKVGDSLENAELRIQGAIIMQDFMEPRKEFSGKTAALNANVDIKIGANDAEAIVKLTQELKMQKFKKYLVSPRKTPKSQFLKSDEDTDTSDTSSTKGNET